MLRSARHTRRCASRPFGLISHLQLAAQQFASLGSWAFAHRRLIERVGTVDVQSHGLGVGALGAGNKGATALRCVVGGSVLTFVNVHLAAFAENTARRNTDMADVFRRLAFPLSAPVDPRQLSPRRPHSLRPEVLATGPDVAHAFEADALFVSGDLNYRIEAAEGDDALVKARSWSELLKRDQLAREREAGRVLQDFAEGEIEHAPTYKVRSVTGSHRLMINSTTSGTTRSTRLRRLGRRRGRIACYGSAKASGSASSACDRMPSCACPTTRCVRSP